MCCADGLRARRGKKERTAKVKIHECSVVKGGNMNEVNSKV